MTAANEPLSIEDVTPVEMGPTEVLVRITASGVCHSDLLFQQGMGLAPPPSILGHEGAGVVEEIARDVRSVRPGDRVVCSWVTSCGQCWFCARGETHLCQEVLRVRTDAKFRRPDGSVASRMMGVGSFADAAVVDERALVVVDTDLPDEQLAVIGCGVTTGVGAVLNTASVEPGSSVAVFGCGGVGQSAIQGARIAGAARIIAVDPVALKRDTALALGATDALDPTTGDVAERIRELTHGRGVDYAFEVAGLEATLAPAHASLRNGGALVLVGVQSPATAFPWTPLEMFARETRVLGCMYGSTQMRRDVLRLVELAETGRLDIAALVSRRITLDEVNDALQAIERGEVIRSVIVA
jgi:S-(hydroxymethyl)glutathione dehydrogenase/alcohol dehydrogenase